MPSIALSCGNFIQIDEADVPLVRQYSWRIRPGAGKNKSYVTRSGSIYLHRVIAGAGRGDVVDHINGDTMDMRRLNLRITTHAGNAMNQCKKACNNAGSAPSSRFKGVSIDARYIGRSKPWQVKIRPPGGSRKHVGCFASDVEAAFAYDMASLEVHGELGRRNFLPLVR